MTILTRLSKSVREQNWFAVFLEFLIVVIGVAVGFQLTQGYDRARSAAREASYLTGIATDFSIYQRLLICRIEAEQEIALGLDHVLDAMAGSAPSEAERNRALFALTMAHSTQPGLPLQGNLQALVQGDLVDTIRDVSLRGRILEAQSTATSSVASVHSINDMILQVPRFDSHLTREKTAESAGFYSVTAFNAEGLAQADGVRDGLINLANYHRASARVVSFQLNAVVGVLERLEALGAYTPPEEPPGCLYGPQPTQDLD
jgi:hypothetical protein